MEYTMMTIKEMRTRLDWNQQYFADYFGIPKRRIEDWEQGVSRCPKYVIDLIEYKLKKEGLIVNNKITFVWARNYDQSQPNNGFGEETDSIVTDGVYDFEDWLSDNDVPFEEEDGVYFVIDEDDERTGEAYMVVSEEPTDEDPRG